MYFVLIAHQVMGKHSKSLASVSTILSSHSSLDASSSLPKVPLHHVPDFIIVDQTKIHRIPS